MLKKKMLRDIMQNKSQFITIFLMVSIGIMVYVGVEAYMSGMVNARDKFNNENNIQDLNVIGQNFTKEDLKNIKKINNVENAERKLELTGIDADDKDKTYLISFIEENNISKFYIIEGIPFDKDKKGVWLDNFYAKENNIKINDTIKIKYDNIIFEEKVLGLINVPDHIYDTKDEKEIIPDRKKFGFVYMSSEEIPENYIKDLIKKETGNNIDPSNYIKNFNYEDYIPYNYIMVDVKDKKNNNQVKNDIEENIENAQAIINIEDTASYKMYQGEIDEAKAYIGIFSGLFLFIAMLSVITTMTRVVKNQKLQIGTLKSLGFNKRKISFHYIGYGLFVSTIGAICGILLGRYFIGNIFLNLEMSFFEVPNGVPVVEKSSYLMAFLTVLTVSLITYFTCKKELKKSPADQLRNEPPKVNNKTLNITTKPPFKNLPFSTKWNLRDILRNKFRTVTALVGIIGCSTLIVCAFGMLNSMNNFIKLQFEELYNFNYKLTIKENIKEEELNNLKQTYGNCTSQTLNIEIKDENGNKTTNNIFVTDANDLVRFKDENDNYIKINNDNGIYVTKKLAQNNNYKKGDKITWHIYGDKKYYTSTIIGFNKDPQNQNVTMTKNYLENLNIKYQSDSLYTNKDLKDVKEIENIKLIQEKDSLKESMQQMLSMMQQMIIIIIIFACILGGVIIYNMGVLSYSEKKYQFATLKVLGFKNKKIRNIFIEQNIWITILAIILGLPSGYYLTKWIFIMCLDDNFDFGVKINASTYLIAAIGTFGVAYMTSRILSKKMNKIDMVSSLKTNE